jgi:hypothetical protein
VPDGLHAILQLSRVGCGAGVSTTVARIRVLRRLIAGGLLAAGLLLGLPGLAPAQLTQTQRFFMQRLLDDPDTSRTVKRLLRSEGGFVDPSVTFRDLTGDRKADAVIRVQSGGATGAVAVYAFSTDTGSGTGRLEAIFRSQRLIRASTAVSRNTMTYTYARYGPADELCCPGMVVEATLRWDEDRHMLRVASRRPLPPPAVVP